MFNYLAFVCGGVNAPSQSPDADGVEMAEKCLRQLEETGNPEQFPPRLLILLTSPAYNDADSIRQMISGIRRTVSGYKKRALTDLKEESPETPLIGSSVEAVFFNREIHERGALLVCLASRLIEAEVQASVNIANDQKEAVDNLLRRLRLSLQDAESNLQTPLTDRLLLTFFPNAGRHDGSIPYLAPELHRLLQQNASFRIPAVGGVSSMPGFQFADDEIYHNELVAARIFTGAPFSSSFGHGLKEIGPPLSVKNLAADGRTVLEFDQKGRPAEILELKNRNDFALLAELSLDRAPFMTLAQAASDGESVTLLRKISVNTLFRRLAPTDFDHVRSEAKRMFEESLQWWMTERPIGCLAINCTSKLRAGYNFRAIAEDAENVMSGINAGSDFNSYGTYFGGFFDGEIGIDNAGRSMFGNWGVVTLALSDEMRERTPAHTGFRAISDTADFLTSVTNLDEAIEGSLKIIFETGFPGAMLSLVMRDKDDEWLVALGAIGSRFKKIKDMTKRPLKENDILAVVARDGELKFIRDSSQDEYCDQKAVKKSGIVSQCILPLFDRQRRLIAILQFDVGDLKRRIVGSTPRLYYSEERILRSLGAVVGATILRVLNRKEADLALGLDNVLIASLREAESNETDINRALQVYIEKAAELFNVRMGHIRLLRSDKITLEMVAGVGDYYEAFKGDRQKTTLDSDSPTALAFNKNGAVVVNNAEEDPWRKSVLDSCGDNLFAYSTLNEIQSFANVPIRDGGGNPIGTISLISRGPWWFTRTRVRAMEALGQRVSYLLDHFKTQKERQFLLDISSDFVRNADFEQPVHTINETVKRFRKAANADIASLFILDKEAERFVLRAEDGWANNKWVDAARYKNRERWTGSVANQETPQYVPDIFAHKMKNAFSTHKDYEINMFGAPVSEDFTFEAIGLPLRLKRDQTIGVLTLFRRIDPKQPSIRSGFTTTNPAILQEAADTISTMLSSLLYNLRMVWLKEEIKRHEDVREALERGDRSLPVEQRLCRQMIKSFHAEQVILYVKPFNKNGQSLLWASAASIEGKAVPTPTEPDQLVKRAERLKKIQEKKKDRLTSDELKTPETAKAEGLLERATLPLLNEKRLVGVLDLYFNTLRRQSSLVSLHDPERMEELGKKIGLAYQRQKDLDQKAEAEARAEKGRLAVQAMGAMVFQTAHRLLNLTQTIRSLSILIEATNSADERKARLSELFKLINSSSDVIRRPMEIARQMKEINLRPFNLHSLLAEAWLEADIQHLSPAGIHARIPSEIFVLVDHGLILEAFRNVIHNAMKAMPKGGELTISATLSNEQRTARILFTDTGVGMSEEQIQAAKSGFVTTQRSTGLGVLISLLLIRAQNGDLDIESSPGEGTTVTITLPAEQQKETA
ncbi:MAG: GAF domain-containing protein [Blastocatellales bacterium]